MGEQGKWKVKASDPENDQLTYSVIWGDEEKIIAGMSPTMSSPTVVQQSTTFTHTYSQPGIYQAYFTVADDPTNNSGYAAQAWQSVTVGQVSSNNTKPKLISRPQLPSSANTGQNTNFNWVASDADGDKLVLSMDCGDNTGSAASCPMYFSDMPKSYGNQELKSSHSWSSNGVKNVTGRIYDCRGGEIVSSFQISVIATNNPPTNPPVGVGGARIWVSQVDGYVQTRINSARVYLYNSAGQLEVSGLTAPYGSEDVPSVGFDGLRAGTYVAKTEPEGYDSAQITITIEGGKTIYESITVKPE